MLTHSTIVATLPWDDAMAITPAQSATYHREVETAAAQMEVAPYNTPPLKFIEAKALVKAGKVYPAGEEDAEGREVFCVEGSGKFPYRVSAGPHGTCECLSFEHGKNSWCKHRVAVKLYQETQRRLTPMGAYLPTTVAEHVHYCPVHEADWSCVAACRDGAAKVCDDCASQPLLGLGPVTVDERLAQRPLPEPVPVTQETAMPTTMPAADEYIPEPEPEPVERPHLPEPPVLALTDLERAVMEWTRYRQAVARFIREHLTAETDYYTLRLGQGRETPPTLSKSGSEKLLRLFALRASFRTDEPTWIMLGHPEGLLCFVCELRSADGTLVGEGRGARLLKKDGGDVNKAIKMGQKSAQLDALLRHAALSDLFTQDLTEEEDAPDKVPESPPVTPDQRDAQRRAIAALLRGQGVDTKNLAACAQAVQEATGLALEPEHFATIITRLQAHAAV